MSNLKWKKSVNFLVNFIKIVPHIIHYAPVLYKQKSTRDFQEPFANTFHLLLFLPTSNFKLKTEYPYHDHETKIIETKGHNIIIIISKTRRT
jgi:hypothetical protein